MKFLIFDTETGGTDPQRNDILQISYQIYDTVTDEKLKEVNHFFPWPEDKSRVQSGAIEVNGLTEKYLATKNLYNRFDAIKEFYKDMDNCDYLVAHNGEFDKSFIISTAYREGINNPRKGWKPMIDTMKTTAKLCKLPSRSFFSRYKFPKLIELANYLKINVDDLSLHDSSADVELTKRCFLYLLKKQYYRLK